MKNTLSEEDAQLFYQIWLPLLIYVDEKCHVLKKDKASKQKLFDVEGAAELAEKLCEDPSLIDGFLEQKENASMPEDQREILLSWKKPVVGTFIMERHLQSGSIMIRADDNTVYLVKGIQSPYGEMFPSYRLPVAMKTILLPWKDCIITDGLCAPYTVTFGPNMRKSFKEAYLEAKKNGSVIKSLKSSEAAAKRKAHN